MIYRLSRKVLLHKKYHRNYFNAIKFANFDSHILEYTQFLFDSPGRRPPKASL